jgi:hypothetical protein
MRKHLLAFALLLTLIAGCSSSGSPNLVAVQAPKAPPLPQVKEPEPSGSYWQKVCNYRQSLQNRLKVTLTPIERCVTLGLETK